MNNVLIVFVAIVVISTLIGAVTQWLKAQQQAEQARAAQNRSSKRSAGRAPTGDVDRFLEEIDKLRRKNAGDALPVARSANPPVVSGPPPVAPRARRARAAEPAPFPSSPPPPPMPMSARPGPADVLSPRRVEDLPIAPVVTGPPVVARPVAPRVSQPKRVAPPTEFGRQLTALLTSKHAVPMALVLTEVLGPPKCKRG
ncbi:hypothetical protein [Fimbriiglobus ruber]|uniref:Uncharacterized protein n=1 Tax=Fimbriiglobus ruber TaxID=1908690 RepID=A0A225DAR4_9BACT|nr:hypothetical protein [Fimbriiglobus ruber]OWK38063.1 hypothetical protein FRUB_07183 [Fimbriiglobus ruber]